MIHTRVEVQHRVLRLLEQVLEVDVLSGVAWKREVGCHASNDRGCVRTEKPKGADWNYFSTLFGCNGKSLYVNFC